MINKPVILNVCLTGMVPTKDLNPAVPVTVGEIVECAKEMYALGASIVHVHARDGREVPTWRKEIYGEIISKIHSECRDLIVCASTSGRTWSEFEKRSAVLELSGKERPDMASLTLGSMNFPRQASVNEPGMILDLLEKMLEKGIKPEYEIFEVGMANWFSDYVVGKFGLKPPYYFNILLGNRGTLAATSDNLMSVVDALPEGSFVCVAGIGQYQLRANVLGLTVADGVRVGLEDNNYMDDNKMELASNRKLVNRVCHIADSLGCMRWGADEVRKMLEVTRG